MCVCYTTVSSNIDAGYLKRQNDYISCSDFLNSNHPGFCSSYSDLVFPVAQPAFGNLNDSAMCIQGAECIRKMNNLSHVINKNEVKVHVHNLIISAMFSAHNLTPCAR